jgi:hypothetical protein
MLNSFTKVIRDWGVIIIFFIVGFVFLSFFSWKIYLSEKIGGGYISSDTEAPETEIEVFTLEELKEALLILEKR